MSFWSITLLGLAAFVAGFFDAAVGGGGLVTIPSLVAALPLSTPLPTILGTNKLLACAGNSLAVYRFIKSGMLEWRKTLRAAACSVLGAAAGVATAYRVSADFMRPLMLGFLVLMLGFILLLPNLGQKHRPRLPEPKEQRCAAGIALILGFYDGFFGPGAGSLLMFSFIALLGFDFLRASAWAKIINLASQLTATVLFVSKGSFIPLVALSMAVANGLGGYWGARAAVRYGTRWVRGLFLIVVSGLVLRLGWQLLGP